MHLHLRHPYNLALIKLAQYICVIIDSIPHKRRPGRPPKVYRPTGRRAANLAMMASDSTPSHYLHPHSPHSFPSTTPLSDVYDPISVSTVTLPPLSEAEILATKVEAERRSHHAQWTQSATLTNNTKLFLQSDPRPSPPWFHVGVVHTLDLIYWFDAQLNDYGRSSTTFSDLVKFDWFGHPGNSPQAANTRRFIVSWVEPSPISSKARQEAITAQRVVHRWKYGCLGTCTQVSKYENLFQPWSGLPDPENNPGPDEKTNPRKPVKVPRDHRCEGNVQLVFEIKCHNLNVVYIYQCGNHSNASPENLRWSRAMRNEVQTAMRAFGARSRQIYQQIVMKYKYPSSTSPRLDGVYQVPDEFPTHRRPTQKQVDNILPALKRRGRLDADPFRAITILAQRNTDKIYNYRPHDYNLPDKSSEFTCALTTPYALETLILHGTKDGLCFNSSWRNKNENRAAMTILVAVDTNGHLSPGSVLLSANIQIPTLCRYLMETERKVIERARVIVSDKNRILHHSVKEKDLIYNISTVIVETNTWDVKKWMIDKSSGLLRAILQFKPTARVIVCQFHIVQAIQQLDGDGGRVKSAPRLPYRVTYNVVRAFRNLQRCRTLEEFPRFRTQFRRELRDACYDDDVDEDDIAESDNDGDPDIILLNTSRNASHPLPPSQTKLHRYKFLLEYFKKYWLCDQWLEYVTDMALPPGETRDGTNNTNNWAESSFLVFDKVFLDMRKNKRIDRLGAIILNEWFPYYEECQTMPVQMSPQIQDDIMRAHALWDANWIKLIENRTYRVKFESNGTVEYMIVNLIIPRCQPCDQFSQTGKYCVHMRAAILYERNGPVSQWETLESESVKFKAKPLGSAAIRRLMSDYPLDKQLSRIVPELLKDPNYTSGPKTSTEPVHPHAFTSDTADTAENMESPFRTSWIHYIGRPGKTRPLQPRRTRRHVVFQKKRGPKRPVRGRNSLFHQSVIRSAKEKEKRNARKRQFFSPKKRSHWTPSPTSKDTYPQLSSPDGITHEDVEIYSPDLRRWDSPHYTMQIEEVQIWAELLNSLSALNSLGTWVGISGSGQLETEVARALRTQNVVEGTFAHRIQTQFAIIFKRIVFVHLADYHWTMWDYTIDNNFVTCQAINPIADVTQLNSVECTTHWEVINSMRQFHCLPHIYNTPKYSYKAVLTGMQKDSASCGFWSIFFILVSMLGLPLDLTNFSRLTIEDVKMDLKSIWLAFLRDPGLDASFIRSVHTRLAPANAKCSLIDLSHGRIVAQRLSYMPSILPYVLESNTTLDESTFAFDTLGQPAFSQVLSTCKDLLNEEELNIVIGGSHFIGPQEIRRILDQDQSHYGTSGQLSDSIINAYSTLISVEYMRRRKYESQIPDFIIADTVITTVLAERPTAGVFRPVNQLKQHGLWFPKVNVFDKDLILLPWHLAASSHWILIVIWPRRTELRVYDSATQTIMRKHKDILKRVLRFLEYEYKQYYPSIAFPETWRDNVQGYIEQSVIENDQQTDAISCGIYVLYFCRSLCQGKPEHITTISTSEITRLRYEIAYAFSKYKHYPQPTVTKDILILPDTPVEALTPTPAPVTYPSSPHTPTPATSPRLKLAQFQSTRPTHSPTSMSPHLAEFPIDPELIAYGQKIKTLKPLPLVQLNDQYLRESQASGVKAGMWRMYKHPRNGLFYPGEIRNVDTFEGTVEWSIPSEIVYCAGTVLQDMVRIESINEHAKTVCIGIRRSQMGTIRWPAVMDASALEMAMSGYTHETESNHLDLRLHLDTPKQELLSFLRAQIPAARDIFSARITTLRSLREDWSIFIAKWPASKRRQMAFSFSELHLLHLDSHDKFIIQHLATWELFLPSNETSAQMDKILGLGQSIFGYFTLANYLRLTPDTAYQLNKSERISRPESNYEKAWKVMEIAVEHDSIDEWGVFRTQHRFIDSTAQLLNLQIVNERSQMETGVTRSSASLVNCELVQPSQPPQSKSIMTGTIDPRAQEQPQHQSTSADFKNGQDIPLAQRRTKRVAAINHAYIKGV